MYERLVTFEEEKRKEYVYVLFNGIFVCASLICIFETIFSAVYLITGNISDTTEHFWLEAVLRPPLSAFAVFLPFFVYNIRQGAPIREKLRIKHTHISPLYALLGVPAIIGLTAFMFWSGSLFTGFLVSNGFVITETLPEVGETLAEQIFYVLFSSAVVSFILEITFRGIITEKLLRVNMGAALFIPAVISSFYTYSLLRMPYAFAVSLVLSWIYIKTRSLWLSVALRFFTEAGIALGYVVKDIVSETEYFDSLFLAAVSGAAVFVVCFGALLATVKPRLEYPVPKDNDAAFERLSGREAFFGTLKAFALWVFVFITVFQLLFTYLDKPELDEEENTAAAQTSMYENGLYSII